MPIPSWFARSTLDEPVLLPGRLSWLRLLAVPLLLGVPHFVFGVPITPGWVCLSLASALLFLLAGRFPVVAAVAQVTLLGAIAHLPNEDTLAFKVAASIAVFEAAMTRPLRLALIPGGLLAVGTIVITSLHSEDQADLIYKIVFVAIAPLLLGAYLHSQHRAARDRHAALVAAESRRRLDERDAAHRERAAIARELHDVVAHHVASIALRSAVARDVLPLDQAAKTVLDEINSAAGLTLTEMRRLVALLRIPTAERDSGDSVEMLDPTTLPDEIGGLVTRIAGVGLRVRLDIAGDLGGLDAGQALTVLRVVQEGLTNVLRHAGAGAEAHVVIAAGAERVAVTVTDDGGGAAPAAGPDGFGLVGLRERLDLIGGELSAGPTRGGWRLDAAFHTGAQDPGQPVPQPDSPSGAEPVGPSAGMPGDGAVPTPARSVRPGR